MLSGFIPLFLQEEDWIHGRNPIEHVLLRAAHSFRCRLIYPSKKVPNTSWFKKRLDEWNQNIFFTCTISWCRSVILLEFQGQSAGKRNGTIRPLCPTQLAFSLVSGFWIHSQSCGKKPQHQFTPQWQIFLSTCVLLDPFNREFTGCQA